MQSEMFCLEISTRQTIVFDLAMFFNKARCSHGAARTSMTYGRVQGIHIHVLTESEIHFNFRGTERITDGFNCNIMNTDLIERETTIQAYTSRCSPRYVAGNIVQLLATFLFSY